MTEYISVVLGHSVCGPVLWQPQETSAEGKRGQNTCRWEVGEDRLSSAV